jgi:hypothetical protein
MMINIRFIQLLLVTIFCLSCQGETKRAVVHQKLFQIPGILELSGAVVDHNRNIIWSIGDNGKRGERKLLGMTSSITFETKVIQILGVKNKDWEAIVLDPRGNLWIMDVGNNQKQRNKLKAYKINPNKITPNGKVSPEQKITFTLEKESFDIEAALYINDRILLFQKKKKSGAKVFELPISSKKITKSTKYGFVKKIKHITDASQTPSGSYYLLHEEGISKIFHKKDHKKSISPKLIHKRRKWGQVESLIYLKKYGLIIGNEKGEFFLP